MIIPIILLTFPYLLKYLPRNSPVRVNIELTNEKINPPRTMFCFSKLNAIPTVKLSILTAMANIIISK